jgi:enamine deaminase RidA (YjgF/YER057c/UK114 family)
MVQAGDTLYVSGQIGLTLDMKFAGDTIEVGTDG